MGRRTEELLERAKGLPELLVRADEFPVALKAEGSRLYDVDNIGYIDYVGGGGAAILGYANQFVLDAVRKVLANGLPDGTHAPIEVELAESLSRFLPWVETWWLCRDQDEAMNQLLPWLRTSSGKDVVLRLDGGASFTCEESLSGVKPSMVRVVPGWTLDRIEAALTGGASKVAAIIVDPLMIAGGIIPAPPEALQRIRQICDDCGVLMVLDERVTGFRVDRGGAAALAGIVPDAAVYGGALGGGFPLGVVAFRQGMRSPGSGVRSGIKAPGVVSMAAAESVLSVLKNDLVYERLESRTAQLVEGIFALGERFSRPMTINRVGSVFGLYLCDHPIENLSDAEQLDSSEYRRLVTALRAEGVLFPVHQGKAAFVSNAHGAKDIGATLEVCEQIFMRMHQEDLP